jgi:hypothetical protein
MIYVGWGGGSRTHLCCQPVNSTALWCQIQLPVQRTGHCLQALEATNIDKTSPQLHGLRYKSVTVNRVQSQNQAQ